VIQRLDFLVRFWELSARHATLGYPLVASEQSELLSLMALVHADSPASAASRPDPANDSFPGQLVGEKETFPVELREVSVAGMRVTCSRVVGEGVHVVVRVADALRGVEYVLPCRVTRVQAGAPATMGLVVDGIPSRITFVSGPGTRGRDPAVMGRPLRRVG
jgi:hypothetical protein